MSGPRGIFFDSHYIIVIAAAAAAGITTTTFTNSNELQVKHMCLK